MTEDFQRNIACEEGGADTMSGHRKMTSHRSDSQVSTDDIEKTGSTPTGVARWEESARSDLKRAFKAAVAFAPSAANEQQTNAPTLRSTVERSELEHRRMQHLLVSVLQERQRLSRDLHDDIGRELIALLSHVRSSLHSDVPAREANHQLQQGIQQVIEKLWALLGRLRPLPLDGCGLDEALHRAAIRPADRTFVSDAHAVSVKNGTLPGFAERGGGEHTFCGMIGRDARMQETFETIRDLAPARGPVLIQGESGTGKELVAQAIHQQSDRARGPFVPVNCGALPEGLLESELFGHVKGAFTGAIRAKKGRFELAHGGSLFLDEVAELPKRLQVKLLRVLQEGTFERVGGEKTHHVDVRLISAANVDLAEEVQRGGFREDLFYRVKVLPISLPPLRDRRNDIPLLAEHFLARACRDGHHTEGICWDALAVLLEHGWPGNVRELQSAIYFALIKSHGALIRPEHLPPDIRQADPAPGCHVATVPTAAAGPAAQPTRERRAPKLTRAAVERAITRTGGNKLKAAKLLGVGRATLYRHLRKHPL